MKPGFIDGFIDGVCLGTLHRQIERRTGVAMPMGIVPFALTMVGMIVGSVLGLITG